MHVASLDAEASLDGYEKNAEILLPSAEVVFLSKSDGYFQPLPICHAILGSRLYNIRLFPVIYPGLEKPYLYFV